MVFKRVGYFRELLHDDSEAPSIHDAVRIEPHPEADRILAYLQSGIGLSGAGRYVLDVLDPKPRGIAPLSQKTDGVWLWMSDLAYYVAKYHVALPDEFLAHMKQNDWKVPVPSPSERSRLGKQLYGEMGGE